MGNKRLIYAVAFSMALLFSVGYYIMFQSMESAERDSVVLYFNQVGLFEKQEGADATIAALEKLDIAARIREQDDIKAVICGISTDKKETKNVQKILEENGYPYVFKEVKTNDEEMIKAIERKDYAEVFERIDHESKGTESE